MKGNREIFLAKHGKSEWNGRKIISGQLNSALSAEGRSFAESLTDVLKTENLSAIHTSTLSRSIDTALPTADLQGLQVTQHEDLREIDVGILQGRFRDERDPESQQIWAEREKEKEKFRIPGGETFGNLKARVDKCLPGILASSDPILIVGHRSTNRLIIRRLMNWSRNKVAGLNLRSKFLYEISYNVASQIDTIQISSGMKFAGFKE